MTFYSPLAFWGLITVPAVIALYLLKQKYEERTVPSIYLWQIVLKDMEASTPWQKLRNNILMILELIAMVLLTLALARPYFNVAGSTEHVVMVIDTSLSMQAEDIKPSRIEHAKDKAIQYINNIHPDAAVTLINMNGNVIIEENQGKDKNRLRDKISKLNATDFSEDTESAQNIIQSILKQYPATKVVQFGDRKLAIPGAEVKFYDVSGAGENFAVMLLSHTRVDNNISVLAKVANFGTQGAEIPLSLYVDGKVFDAKYVKVESGRTANVYWNDVPQDANILECRIDKKDSLERDNIAYNIVSPLKTKRVALISQKNLFIEKILGLMKDVELFKSGIEDADDLRGYDLYIFDGYLPRELPSDGNIMVFNPPENNFFTVKAIIEYPLINDSKHELFKFVNDYSFSIGRSKGLELPQWGEAVLESEDEVLIFAGTREKSRVIVFGFDIHNTDLPLKPAFPILMTNALNWLVPSGISNTANIFPGQQIEFNLDPETIEAKVITPENQSITIAPPFPVSIFNQSNTVGVYRLVQILPDKEMNSFFSVNAPAEKESNLIWGSLEGQKPSDTSIDQDDSVQQPDAFMAGSGYNLRGIILWILLCVLVIESWIYIRLSNWRNKTVLGLRVAVLMLVILSILGIGIKKVSDEVTTIFVVDGSESVLKKQTDLERFVKNALQFKRPGDKVGIVRFGTTTEVEFAPQFNPDLTSFQTKVNGSYTNIEQALEFAATLIPGEDRKRIVLVTDGQENVGDALKQSKILKQQDIALDIYPVITSAGPEVQLKRLVVPENMRINQKFEIEISIDSTVNTKGMLKLFNGKELTSEKQVELQQGMNRFVFSGVAAYGGIQTYSATIEPALDTILANNSISAFCYVEDKANILVVQDSDRAAEELIKMLGDRVNIEMVRPANVPVALEEMLKYDAFILSNVSAEKIDNRFLESLEDAVGLQGKGLLVTGGENSYAVGGYYKTPLETILPVYMDIKPKEEVPNLGLVLVIDKSGSMSSGQYGISKLELAKEAAIRATEVLREEDSIGIIAFDSAVKWVVDLQKAEDLHKIESAIGSIRPDGGTSILPPLEAAYHALKDADTKLKHIILLTDGQAEKTGYEPVLEGIKEAGITLSTVAVGMEADAWLLQTLAMEGSGRFYMTDEFTDIPKIFAKETFLAGKTYLNNYTFTPELAGYSEILDGIKTIPSLDGYVGTTAKNTAKVILKSDRDDPVLATWQYGLGRTAAWTSDAAGIWTANWLEWEESATFWRNLISWISQKRVPEEYSINTFSEAGKGIIDVVLPLTQVTEETAVEATIISPLGAKQTLSLEPTAPGAYRGSFDSGETGVYVANIMVKQTEEVAKSFSTGISIPYSPEYDIIGNDSRQLLQKLAIESGGRIIEKAEDVFSGKLPPVVSITDITPLLLIMAMILIMAEIVLRRLGLTPSRIKKVFTKINNFFGFNRKTGSRKTFDHETDNYKTDNHKTDDHNTDFVRSPVTTKKIRYHDLDSKDEDGITNEKIDNNKSDGKPDNQGSSISILLDKKRKRDKQ